MTNRVIEREVLDSLIEMLEEDKTRFYQTYSALPFNIFLEIEKLSMSKTSFNKSLCLKARRVANTFHNNFK